MIPFWDVYSAGSYALNACARRTFRFFTTSSAVSAVDLFQDDDGALAVPVLPVWRWRCPPTSFCGSVAGQSGSTLLRHGLKSLHRATARYPSHSLARRVPPRRATLSLDASSADFGANAAQRSPARIRHTQTPVRAHNWTCTVRMLHFQRVKISLLSAVSWSCGRAQVRMGCADGRHGSGWVG
jgi:hypothetical protein